MTLHCSLLFLNSVSHLLKLILCRLEREHPVEAFNFRNLLLAYSLLRNLTVKASVSVVTTYYMRVSDAAVVSVFISAKAETSSNCIRCLAMDDRVDSNNESLSRTPQYYNHLITCLTQYRFSYKLNNLQVRATQSQRPQISENKICPLANTAFTCKTQKITIV
jgi:hypothetical protein